MLKGNLRKWNDDKGFGFVRPENEARDIFIHISALKNMSRRPRVGDVIHFDVEIDDSGKARAINASIEGVSSVFNPDQALVLRPKQSVRKDKGKPSGMMSSYRTVKPKKSRSRAGFTLGYLLVIVVGLLVYDKVTTRTELVNNIIEPASEVEQVKDAPRYHCEGKTRCSEMSSCEEAEFYLNNCPGTEMDGDNDGRPCEDWCGH